MCMAVFSSIPLPVSIRSRATPVRVCRVRAVSWPPSGIASKAFLTRFTKRRLQRLLVQQDARQIRIEIADDVDVRLLGLGREQIQHAR